MEWQVNSEIERQQKLPDSITSYILCQIESQMEYNNKMQKKTEKMPNNMSIKENAKSNVKIFAICHCGDHSKKIAVIIHLAHPDPRPELADASRGPRSERRRATWNRSPRSSFLKGTFCNRSGQAHSCICQLRSVCLRFRWFLGMKGFTNNCSNHAFSMLFQGGAPVRNRHVVKLGVLLSCNCLR